MKLKERTFGTPYKAIKEGKFPPATRKYSGKRPEKSEKAFRRAEKFWKRFLVLDY